MKKKKYEISLVTPVYNEQENLFLFRKEVENIHKRSGQRKFGIPPLMLKMYRDHKIK